jgi:RNA polymerase sigma-70 factor (ECF subfamily)
MQMAIASFKPFMVDRDLLRQLIQEAKAGSADSFDRLVALHERRVLRLAQRLLLNREVARDATQDVFLRLYRNLAALNEEKDVTAWLYRTTANVCFDILRKARHELALDVTDTLADDPDPEQSAAAQEQKLLLLSALKELSPREREAIVLRDLEGYSTAETARLLGSTETTVRSQISTGRVKMKNFLAARMGERT